MTVFSHCLGRDKYTHPIHWFLKVIAFHKKKKLKFPQQLGQD